MPPQRWLPHGEQDGFEGAHARVRACLLFHHGTGRVDPRPLRKFYFGDNKESKERDISPATDLILRGETVTFPLAQPLLLDDHFALAYRELFFPVGVESHNWLLVLEPFLLLPRRANSQWITVSGSKKHFLQKPERLFGKHPLHPGDRAILGGIHSEPLDYNAPRVFERHPLWMGYPHAALENAPKAVHR